MKKIFTLLICALCTTALQAQIVSSTSTLYQKTETAKEKSTSLRFFHAGIGSNSFVGSDFDDAENMLGFQFGYQFQKKKPSKAYFHGMDFSIGTRGWKYDKNGYENSYQAWNVQWSPFLFGFDIKANDYLNIRPQFGLFMSIDFGGNFEYKGNGYKDKCSIWETDGDYFPIDAGYHAGVDIIYRQRWIAGLMVKKGNVPYDVDNLKGGALNFLFHVGIVVGNK